MKATLVLYIRNFLLQKVQENALSVMQRQISNRLLNYIQWRLVFT